MDERFLENILILPKNDKLPKSRHKYKKTKYKKKINKIMINFLKNSHKTYVVSEKLDLLLNEVVNMSKSQGGYICLTEFNENDELQYLLCKNMIFSNKFGNQDDIVEKDNLPINVYFPMNKDMLHYKSAMENKILVSNSKKYMNNHKCPGINLNNILYYPLNYNNKKLD